MSWTSFPDKIFLINLAKRKDRLESATRKFKEYNIPFERVEAVEHEKGAEGLRITMETIFQDAINNAYKNILIFEDDLDIIEPEINTIMPKVIQELPSDYDIIYLGCQLCNYVDFHSNHLIRSHTMYATHAAMYSLQAMKKFMELPRFSPVDNFIVQYIQCSDRCFCTFPILASQIPSHSDIYSDQEIMDWRKYIQVKYWHQMDRMKLEGKFTTTERNFERYVE